SEIDDKAVVDHAVLRNAVTAATHGKRQVMRACKPYRFRHVPHVRRAHDRQWATIHREVLYLADHVIAQVMRQNHVATDPRHKCIKIDRCLKWGCHFQLQYHVSYSLLFVNPRISIQRALLRRRGYEYPCLDRSSPRTKDQKPEGQTASKPPVHADRTRSNL